MNFDLPKISKWRTAGLLNIVQGPSLREQFQDLLRLMCELPLTPHDLAEFLRLVGYDQLCKAEVADSMLSDFIAHLQGLLSKSTVELLEVLRALQAREWPADTSSPLWPVPAARNAHNEPSGFPVFRVLSFHDPPGRKR